MGLGNEVCRAVQHLTQSIGRFMDFNAELWDERFKELCARAERIEKDLKTFHVAVFGNGEKENSIDDQVRQNTKFRKEMEGLMTNIRNDIVKRMVWAGLFFTVIMLGGFAGIIIAIINILPK